LFTLQVMKSAFAELADWISTYMSEAQAILPVLLSQSLVLPASFSQ